MEDFFIFVQQFLRLTLWSCFIYEVLSKMTQIFKSNTKITYVFFETLFCPIYPRSSSYSRKCHYFLSENNVFTLPSSSSPNIYNFAIYINTSTTMNYQIESINALKFRFFLIIPHFLSTQTTYLTLSLKIHQKNWRFWLQIM